MAVIIELLKFFVILISYLAVGTIIGGITLKFILSRFKIKIKDNKKVYLIPFFVYTLVILSQIFTAYIHKIFSLIFLLLILYLIYYLTKIYFNIKVKLKQF